MNSEEEIIKRPDLGLGMQGKRKQIVITADNGPQGVKIIIDISQMIKTMPREYCEEMIAQASDRLKAIRKYDIP